MSIVEIVESAWQANFPGCEPIAHELRSRLPDRWVRFHSLPNSKRYAESDGEYQTLFRRHNAVLGRLATPRERVLLLTTEYGNKPDEVSCQDEVVRSIDPDAVFWRAVKVRDGDYTRYWHLFVSQWEWQSGIFDPLIRATADCEVSNVMLLATDGRWLLHPYDGGMDVILRTGAERGELRAAFSEWLSFRSDGL